MSSQGEMLLERSRFADFFALTKPELTFLSVITALGGLYLGAGGTFPAVLMLHTLFGTALVGAGAGALNQYIEREYDANMRRTENRPLPAGRMAPWEVLLFGSSIAILGVLQLTLFANVLTGSLAVVTLVTYLFLYTPLKRITWVSTIVGGIPGALPPVIGWTAIRNEISIEAGVLFAILFFWQMPHFFSLAWMYRKDYERAGFPMLAVLDRNGLRTSRQILIYCTALIAVSVLLSFYANLGMVYIIGSLSVGIAFLIFGLQLWVSRSNASARRLFYASLIYLPALLFFMVIDTL
ncbi:MAG: heme o synthase [Ignavibacteria bacterium]|nr:heme o synthase [Ignavibacteria bacterium]